MLSLLIAFLGLLACAYGGTSAAICFGVAIFATGAADFAKANAEWSDAANHRWNVRSVADRVRAGHYITDFARGSANDARSTNARGLFV
jgi:hypothetical protein